MNLQTQANAIALAAAPKVGINFSDVLQIILKYLPLVIQCAGLMGVKPEDAKAAAQDHYDETSGQYDSSFIDGQRRHMRRAARQSGHPHLSAEQLDTLTVAAMDQARTEDADVVAATVEEAS